MVASTPVVNDVDHLCNIFDCCCYSIDYCLLLNCLVCRHLLSIDFDDCGGDDDGSAEVEAVVVDGVVVDAIALGIHCSRI